MPSGLQMRYFAEYRYAEFRRSAQDFMLDVMAPTEFSNNADLNDEIIDAIPDSVHWLERYYAGYHGKDGLPVFTTPMPQRMEKIRQYMASCPSQSSISTMGHSGNLFRACNHAVECDYNKMADQRFFGARLRGDHLCCEYFDDRAVVTILIFHLLDGEPLVRVRRIRAHFLRKPGELDASLKTRVLQGRCDFHDVRDGFATTGTDYGILFGGFRYDRSFSQFSWDKKSNRILGFSLKSADTTDDQTFRLVRLPHDVNKLYNIYDAISSQYDLPEVA